MFVGIFFAGVIIIITQGLELVNWYKNKTINEMIGEIWPDVQI